MERKPFVYSNGQITDLDIEIGGWYGVVDINDNSDVLVNTDEGSKIVKNDGTSIEFEFFLKGMNNKCEAVGYRSLYKDGQRVDLTVFGEPARPYAINDYSVIVGDYISELGLRSFKWKNGVAETLYLPDQCGDNTAYDINNSGQIVGDTLKSDGVTYPCLWEDDDCRFFAILGGEDNHINAINDFGVAVGMSQYYNGNYNAVVYFEDEVIDLNHFLPEDTEWLYLREAVDINNRGEIVGIGHIQSPYYTIPETPSTFGFLATPIPEPSCVILLGLGLGFLAKKRLSAQRHT